jgi:hypothetical protein
MDAHDGVAQAGRLARLRGKEATMSEPPPLSPLPRVAKGARPYFLDSPDAERVLGVVLAVAAEVSALRDRLDTVERLGADGRPFTLAEIEAYRPDPDVAAARAGRRRAFIERALRGFLAAEAPFASYEDLMKEFAE